MNKHIKTKAKKSAPVNFKYTLLFQHIRYEIYVCYQEARDCFLCYFQKTAKVRSKVTNDWKPSKQ